MPEFSYSALNSQDSYIKGKVEAGNAKKALAKLEGEGLMVVTLKAEKVSKQFSLNQLLGRVSRLDRIFFTSHLYTLLEAGVAMDQAIKVTAEQASTDIFRNVLLNVHTRVQHGEALWSALAQHSKHFPEFFINLVRLGESSGRLVEVLHYLLEQQERDYELITRARGAMVYPAVIILAMFAIITLMMVFVIPQITSLLTEYAVELPLPTKVLIFVSQALINWGGFIFPIAFLLLTAFVKWVRTPIGQPYWDEFLLSLPKLKSIVREFNLARIARALGALLKSGVPIDRAMILAATVVRNTQYRAVLKNGVTFVQKGIPLGEVLRGQPKLFPPVTIRMIEVGERTGKLDHMLARLASFYEKAVMNTLANLSSIIEPVLLLLIGCGAGFVAIAILTPIWKFAEAI